MALGVLIVERKAVSTVPTTLSSVVVTSIAHAIANVRRMVDLAVGILLVEVKTVSTVPTALGGIVVTSITRAITN